MLPESYYAETKWMCFSIDDDNLLKNYNDIGNKVSSTKKRARLQKNLQ